MKDIILTGIKPTGTPHIGNYWGAIKPAIDLVDKTDGYFYYFIADFHSLNIIKDKSVLKKATKEVACTWLACGLDPNKVVLYRQSDVPEIFEITSILTNVTAKGLLNRAHAYKSVKEQNKLDGNEEDYGVNAGLFNYPVLMAADILTFNSTKVPVGLDQKQHVEIARDIAQAFNSVYGKNFVVPEPLINEDVATIIGLDGRKMSKSYGNTIMLFDEPQQLLKNIKRIVTDSSMPGEPKSTNCTLFKLYKLFSTPAQLKEYENKFHNGISWNDAKMELYNLINSYATPMREKYNYYLNNYHLVEKILEDGAKQAREVAKKTLSRTRIAIGIDEK